MACNIYSLALARRARRGDSHLRYMWSERYYI